MSECRSTIKKVVRDMARGKAFPHCAFVSADGSNGSDDIIKTRMYLHKIKGGDKHCPDGETKRNPISTNSNAFCNAIEIKIKEGYVADKDHETQIFFYEK